MVTALRSFLRYLQASRPTTPRRSYASCWMRWNSSPPTTCANRMR
jgi:hypothetical protein